MRNRDRSHWQQALWQVPLILFMAGLAGLCVNYLRPDSIPMVGDWSAKAGMAEGKTEENFVIPLEGAAKLFSAGLALFIDARDEQDYMEGHIKGALSLPWDDVQRRFPKIAGDIPRGKMIIIYCDGEACHLSHDLAIFLRGNEFQNVWELVNGMTVWREADLPVEEGTAGAP